MSDNMSDNFLIDNMSDLVIDMSDLEIDITSDQMQCFATRSSAMS